MRLLNLGCGTRHHQDWINIDVRSGAPDVLAHDLSTGVPFKDASFDVVYHSHLLEHLDSADAELFLLECLRVLAPNGILRLAVPDLEGIARSYLRCLEQAESGDVGDEARHEWSIVELVDQCTRHVPGGRMQRWWRQSEIPAKGYIVERLGAEARDSIERLRHHPEQDQGVPRDPLAVGRFRLSGEAHLWMYDRLSLTRLLKRLGFTEIVVRTAQESDIPDFEKYLLDVEADGAVRKPDSLFIEARKARSAPSVSVGPGQLKVVHLCAHANGGAGNAAVRLHTGLRDQGIDSHLYVLKNKGTIAGVHPVPFEGALPIGSPEGHWNSPHWDLSIHRFEQIYKRYPERPKGLELFSDPFAQGILPTLPHLLDADIINFHWLPGMVDFEKDLDLLAGRKIVWTMHDMNPMTGGCHYSFDCDRYRHGCGACWQLGSREADLSGIFFSIKRRAYTLLDLTLVSPSRWLAGVAAQSRLLGDKICHVIPNGLPTDIFRPLDRKALRTQLGIPAGARVILFGSHSNAIPRKGLDYLRKALSHLSTDTIPGLTLAIYGEGGDIADIGLPYIHFGTLNNAQQVAMAYNAADVFVAPSISDNLPNTVLESLACGTPVAAFDVGGMPDMIEHGRTGWLAPAKDAVGLAEGIRELLHQGGATALGRACRAAALTNWAIPVQARRYIELYQCLLHGDSGEQQGRSIS
jgi:glycosyltransferase involved in cell wall biosynthesis/SAM-dependent methyltransferase